MNNFFLFHFTPHQSVYKWKHSIETCFDVLSPAVCWLSWVRVSECECILWNDQFYATILNGFQSSRLWSEVRFTSGTWRALKPISFQICRETVLLFLFSPLRTFYWWFINIGICCSRWNAHQSKTNKSIWWILFFVSDMLLLEWNISIWKMLNCNKNHNLCLRWQFFLVCCSRCNVNQRHTNTQNSINRVFTVNFFPYRLCIL